MGVNRLSFPKRGRRFFFKVRIFFSCRKAQFTSYSDSKPQNDEQEPRVSDSHHEYAK